MTKCLISPSESKLAAILKDDAIVSSLPEEKGADVLIYTKQGLVGVQRKEIPNDFLASITDGRIARETSLLPKGCKFCLLLLEGRFKYWPDGRIALGRKEPSKFTEAQVRGILFDIKYVKGVDYDYTEDAYDTVAYMRAISRWMDKEKHLSLFSRPGGTKGTWVIPTAKEVHSWVLQGFDGIGPSLADAIIEHFGRVPLAWTCSLEELAKVPRLSTKRAKILWQSLSGTAAPVSEGLDEFDSLRRKLRGV